jgi:hypothetical protein
MGRGNALAEGVILQSNLLYLTPLYRKNPKALQEELPKIFALLLWRKSPRLLRGPRVHLLWIAVSARVRSMSAGHLRNASN